jgi:site-specific recombinase XerC
MTLKVFFTVVGKDPADVEARDVLAFVKEQRKPRPGQKVVSLDGGGGLALSTVKRRLSSLSRLYSFLVARGDLARTPVLRTVSTRARRCRQRGGPSCAPCASCAGCWSRPR